MIRFLSSPLPLLSVLLCLVAAPGSAVHAVEVDVYTGQTVVADQGVAERRKALPLALANALGKHSGVREPQSLPGWGEALAVAPEIVVSYYYDMAEFPRADGSVHEQLRLRASFVASRVDELARQLGLPLWRADRQALEVWIVVDDGLRREILPLEMAYLEPRLDDVARQRGQPLLWPRPDEDGMYPVDTRLLWGGYTEDLASPRGTGVLILAAYRLGPGWGLRVNLGFGGEHHAWRLEGLDLEKIAVDGLQLAIDQIAASRSIGASGLASSSLELTVEGVNTAPKYQALMVYLESLALVEQVDVIAARPTGIDFRLGLNALPDYLLDVFEQDGVIEAGQEPGVYRLADGELTR